jgi:hypothetical protein
MAAIGPMLIIGFGTCLPWGLADGFSIGDLPKERGGMAKEASSTMRVAGEVVALPIVSGVLASLIKLKLAGLGQGDLGGSAGRRFAADAEGNITVSELARGDEVQVSIPPGLARGSQPVPFGTTGSDFALLRRLQ